MSLFHQIAGTGKAPWEIGQAQPTLLKMAEKGVFTGSILDVGCGDCHNAIAISKATGLKVTSFDFVPRAVEDAKKRVAEAGANVEVLEADVFNLDASPLAGRTFDTILDSAIFHIWTDEQRLAYRDVLAKLVNPGGCYIVLVFGDKCRDYPEQPFKYPRKVSKGEIEELFSEEQGWKVESVDDEEAVYRVVMVVDGRLEDCRALAAVVRRL